MSKSAILINEFNRQDVHVIHRLDVTAAELRGLFRFEGLDTDVYLSPLDSDGSLWLVSRNSRFALQDGEAYIVGGEPSQFSFAVSRPEEPRLERPWKAPVDSSTDITLPPTPAKAAAASLSPAKDTESDNIAEEGQDAIYEYLVKHSEIEFWLINDKVPAALPWHCRGNANRNHRKDWKWMVSEKAFQDM